MFQVEWGRFLRELGAEIPVLQDFAGEEVHFDGGESQRQGVGTREALQCFEKIAPKMCACSFLWV